MFTLACSRKVTLEAFPRIPRRTLQREPSRGILVNGVSPAHAADVTTALYDDRRTRQVVRARYRPSGPLDGRHPRRYCTVMTADVLRLIVLKRLGNKIRELLSKAMEVRYVSVAVWKPWRDF
jgi:hypothetical protein